MIYNKQVDTIKLKERPDQVVVKLGRNKNPAPIELGLMKKFVKLDKSRSRLLDKDARGGVDFSLFTAKYPLPQTPNLVLKKKAIPTITEKQV